MGPFDTLADESAGERYTPSGIITRWNPEPWQQMVEGASGWRNDDSNFRNFLSVLAVAFGAGAGGATAGEAAAPSSAGASYGGAGDFASSLASAPSVSASEGLGLSAGTSAAGGTAALSNAAAGSGGGTSSAAATGGNVDELEALLNSDPSTSLDYMDPSSQNFDWSQFPMDGSGGINGLGDIGKWALANKGLLGGGLGALLGGLKGGSRPAGTTTTVQDIPDWLKPYVQGNLNMAGGARDSLLSGPNVTNAATPQYLKTINGDYLMPGSNPFLDATYQHAANLMGANVDSRFEASGRYGSGAHQGVLQEGLSNLGTSIYGGNYQAERARQEAAVTGAPAFATNAATAAYAPYTGYSSLFPNVRSTTAPYFNNPMAGILGGALAGKALAG